MKETTFIEQNKAKWAKFEKDRRSNTTDPEELGRLYSEISNDLSYAKTFYEKRTVRAYLNGLAQSIHGKLYKQKKEPIKSLLKAWTVHIPLEIYKARKNLLFALVMFLLWAAIGVISSYFDPDFAELILGSGYITLTEQNILEGNPLGIYGNESQTSMFFSITLNNIGVALKCFFAGILFSVGTHIILFQNAIMVGAFQYFFKLKGLLLTSFLTIWIHGAFEISAIVIASGAGFTLGHGLLFPGSYSRLQSFQINAMRGIRILISLIPIFIIAGALESFVTRNYQILPDWSKWMIILFSFAVVIFYYVVYPIFVARKYPELLHEKELPNYVPKKSFNLHSIRSSIEVIGDTFQFYRTYFKKIFRIIFTVAVPMIMVIGAIQFFHHFPIMGEEHFFDWYGQLSILFGNVYADSFNPPIDLIISFAWILPITIMASAVFYAFHSLNEPFSWQHYFTYLKSRVFSLLFGVGLIYLLIAFLPFYIQIPFILLFPLFLLLPASAGLYEAKSRIQKGFQYSSRNWAKNFGVLVFFSVCIFLAVQPIAFVFSIHEGRAPLMSDLLDIITNFVKQFLVEETAYYVVVSNVIRQIVYLLAFIFLIPLVMIATGFLFHSSQEEVDAVGLRKEFDKFGKRSRTQETQYDYED
jgi:uncharacterized membrane protein SpoIIM required for sporulation